MEPAWEAGRSLLTGERTPEADLFIRKFQEAEELLNGRMRLVFSAARSDELGMGFCSVCTNSFVVTAEGLVSSCYEVCEQSDPRAARFIYGAWKGSDFAFDETRREALHDLRVDHMPYCDDCFCKYHCSGDCAAKLLGLNPPEQHAGSERCRITRALTLRQIQRALDEKAPDSMPGDEGTIKKEEESINA